MTDRAPVSLALWFRTCGTKPFTTPVRQPSLEAEGKTPPLAPPLAPPIGAVRERSLLSP